MFWAPAPPRPVLGALPRWPRQREGLGSWGSRSWEPHAYRDFWPHLPAPCSFHRDVKPDNILLDGGVSRGHEWPKPQLGDGVPHPQDMIPQTVALSSFLTGHAHLTDFSIATIIKDGERATALAGPSRTWVSSPRPARTPRQPADLALHPNLWLGDRVPSLKVQQQVTGQAASASAGAPK